MDEAKLWAQLQEITARLERLEAANGLTPPSASTFAPPSQSNPQSFAPPAAAPDVSNSPVSNSLVAAVPVAPSPQTAAPSFQPAAPQAAAPSFQPAASQAAASSLPSDAPAPAFQQPMPAPQAAVPSPQPAAPAPSFQPATAQAAAPASPKATGSLESFIGRYVLAGLATLLLIIGAVTFTVLVWDSIADWIKLTVVGALALVFSVIGATVAKLKPRLNVVAAALSGTGAALGFVTILSSALYFHVLKPDALLPVTIVWTLILLGLTFLTHDSFTVVITSIGVAVTFVFGIYWMGTNPTLTSLISLLILVVIFNVALFVVFYFAFETPRWSVPLCCSFGVSLVGMSVTFSWASEFFVVNRILTLLALITAVTAFLLAATKKGRIGAIVATTIVGLWGGAIFLIPTLQGLTFQAVHAALFLIVIAGALTVTVLLGNKPERFGITDHTFPLMGLSLAFAPWFAALMTCFSSPGLSGIQAHADSRLIATSLVIGSILILVGLSIASRGANAQLGLLVALVLNALLATSYTVLHLLVGVVLLLGALALLVMAQLRTRTERNLPQPYLGLPTTTRFLNNQSSTFEAFKVAFLFAGTIAVWNIAKGILEYVHLDAPGIFTYQAQVNAIKIAAVTLFLVALTLSRFSFCLAGILPSTYTGINATTLSPEQWEQQLRPFYAVNRQRRLPRTSFYILWAESLFLLLLTAATTTPNFTIAADISLLLQTLLAGLLTWRLFPIPPKSPRLLLSPLAAWLLCQIWFYQLTGLGLDSVASSVISLVIGAIAIFAGFWLANRPVRIFGLVIVLLSVLKIVTLDVSNEGSLLRVIMLVVGGVLCLLISLAYTWWEKRLR